MLFLFLGLLLEIPREAVDLGCLRLLILKTEMDKRKSYESLASQILFALHSSRVVLAWMDAKFDSQNSPIGNRHRMAAGSLEKREKRVY
jgi:hypothetical protein